MASRRLELAKDRAPTFFMCRQCGSAVESVDQQGGHRKLCIYRGITDDKGNCRVIAKCLVCDTETATRTNCVYQSFMASTRRDYTVAEERIDDPTFPRVQLECRFADCGSKRFDDGVPNYATYQKSSDDNFQLQYTCHTCKGTWTG